MEFTKECSHELIETVFEYFSKNHTCITDLTICVERKEAYLECLQAFAQAVLGLL